MSKITKYRFSDLYEMSSGLSSTKEQAGHGSPFVSFSVVYNNYFLPDELTDKMDTSNKEQETFSVLAGDVFVTRTSETIDELAMSSVALKDYPQATYSGFVKRLRPKTTGIVYSKFLAFYLRSNLFRETMTNNATMTLRASFNEDIFSFLFLYLPEFEEQVKIGNLLYNMEIKMRNNKKINDNLEQQIKLIYDYWFTQFDFPDENGKPYRSSGGKMVWNEKLKRDIPLGWHSDILKTLCQLDLGGTPDTSIPEYWNGTVNWLNSGEVAQFPIISSELKITEAGVANSPAKIMPIGTVVVSITGNIRASVLAIDTCANQSVVGIIESKTIKNMYLYPLMCNQLKYYTSISTGNCQKHINKGTLEDSLVLIPPQKILGEYYNRVNPLYNQIRENAKESNELIHLRDWLLPMLMNGQATIAD